MWHISSDAAVTTAAAATAAGEAAVADAAAEAAAACKLQGQHVARFFAVTHLRACT